MTRPDPKRTAGDFSKSGKRYPFKTLPEREGIFPVKTFDRAGGRCYNM